MKRRTALGYLGAMAISAPAAAQGTLPNRPIQLIVPVSPGGVADQVARLYGDRLSKMLGTVVTVQNRPGAGTAIGTQSVATSAPDGTTILATNSAHTIAPFVQANLPYDPARDFVGIAMVADAPAAIAVSAAAGIRSLKELIEQARAKPRTLSYTSAGVGSATHLAGAHFAAKAGIELLHVPYKNQSDGTTDLVAGRVHLVFAPPGFLHPLVRDGKVIALGVSSPEGITQPFEAPSVQKATGIDYEYTTWYGFLAPARTPRPIVEAFAKALQEAGNDPELKAALVRVGVQPRVVLGREFDAAMKAETERIRPLITASDIKTN